MSRTLRVLVTNDDGIGSEGLRWLALAAREAGHEVTVAAPAAEASGSSAALTAVEEHGRVVVERRRLPGLDGVAAHSVRAMPGFIALIAAQGAFGAPPDVVLSGINRGPNTGRAVVHSGTVGAAVTAAVNGLPAMAVSVEVGSPMEWAGAAHIARRLLPLLCRTRIAAPVFNVNVPGVPLERIRGLRHAGLAPFGSVRTTVAERGRGFVRMTLSAAPPAPEPDTDTHLLARGFATLTVLHPLTAAPAAGLPPLPDIAPGSTA
ncbi:5'/3'-nucleotidase SurE [Streptomyces sp. NPDC002055]|uniref:5'/3'-nucleotidase SurE n=1 Tax=Streptomyces sp. NPDC002055 TaxID=3154534 RepID=UPI003331D43C